MTVTADEQDWKEQFAAQHRERIGKLEALANRLTEEDPTLDAEVMDLYIEQQDELGRAAFEAHDANPFEDEAETNGAAARFEESPLSSRLRERLGTLRQVDVEETGLAQIDDPLAASAVTMGWAQRSGNEIGMKVFVADPTVSSQAILRFICAGDATEVTYGFSTN